MADKKKTEVAKDRKKTECPISLAEFKTGAKTVKLQIGDTTVSAAPKEFATGSFGWYANGKITLDVGGKEVTAQLGMNLIIVGSKEAPEKPEAADKKAE